MLKTKDASQKKQHHVISFTRNFSRGKMHSQLQHEDLPQEKAGIAEENRYRSLLHTIQKGKKKLPFFFFHGDWQGMPLYAITIARTCGREQPFYTLDPFIRYTSQPPISIRALATAYRLLICEIHPEGPYLLGGYSNGAIFAYEVARQLEEEGKNTKLLTLIDTPTTFLPTTGLFYKTTRAVSNVLRLTEQQAWANYLRLRHFLRRIKISLFPTPENLGVFQIELSGRDPEFNKFFPRLETLCKDNMGNFFWQFGNYQWRRYSGKITLIECEDKPVLPKDWAQECITYNSETYIMPGSHSTIVTEHIKVLAEQVKSCINIAQVMAEEQA